MRTKPRTFMISWSCFRCTVIVVAHRLSTVMNTDNIVVLNHDRITEHGRHEAPVAAKGAYYNLVKDQFALGK